MHKKEYFILLGLEPNSSKSAIKSAYYKLAKQYHPDRTQGDEFLQAMFVKIQSAYEFLMKDAGTETTDTKSTKEGTTTVDDDLLPLVDQYLEVKDQVTEIETARRQFQNKAGSPFRFASLVIALSIMLVLMTIFYPTRFLKEKVAVEGKPATENLITVYQKANVQSSKIGEVSHTAIVDTLRTTQYFYQIRYSDKGRTNTGFVLKR